MKSIFKVFFAALVFFLWLNRNTAVNSIFKENLFIGAKTMPNYLSFRAAIMINSF